MNHKILGTLGVPGSYTPEPIGECQISIHSFFIPVSTLSSVIAYFGGLTFVG